MDGINRCTVYVISKTGGTMVSIDTKIAAPELKEAAKMENQYANT